MTSKIKVLHIGIGWRRGGIEMFLLNLCSAMDKDRYDFSFVSYWDEVADKEQFSSLGNIIQLENRRNPVLYRSNLKKIYKNGYDIIHIHKNSAVDFMPFLCTRYSDGAKIIAHAHNTSASNNVRTDKLLNNIGQRSILKHADLKLACSMAAGKWLYGSEDNIDLFLPNGIKLNQFAFNLERRSEMRCELGIKDEIVIGCVGRFVPAKNQEFIFKIMQILSQKNVPATALFLGDGYETSDIPAAFHNAGIADRAIFTGAVDNVNDYMLAMDVLAMPSLFEGFPIVAVEAQASCLPVILSENITDEVKLSPVVEIISIAGEDGPTRWANYIASQQYSDVRETEVSAKVQEFDVSHTAELISHAYNALLESHNAVCI